MLENNGENSPPDQKISLPDSLKSRLPNVIKNFKKNIDAAGRSTEKTNEAIIEYSPNYYRSMLSITVILENGL